MAQEVNPKDYILVRDKDSGLYSAKQRTLQNNNREQQIRKVHERKGYMSEIRDVLDLRDLLDSGKRVYDGRGILVSTLEKKSLLDEMAAKRNPWRGEYFGNRFFNHDGKWYMESRFRVINNEIKPLLIKEVHPIMQYGWTSFKYLDEDGLAIKLKGEEVYFCPPTNNAVAGLFADSGRVSLGCYGDPLDSNPWLGMRESRENFEV